MITSSVGLNALLTCFLVVPTVFARAGADLCLQNRTTPLSGLEADLALIFIMGKGNDYLPSLRVPNGSGESLWKTYLKLRLRPQWMQQ